MKFKKYQCLENDFIIIENDFVLDVKTLCDQHKGIGADGLIIISNNDILFFNKDGTKAKFCGNGIRCAAKYINDNINNNQTNFTFENDNYNINHINNIYSLEYPVPKFSRIGKMYLVNTGVEHIVTLEKPSKSKAINLFNKYNRNITFFYNNTATTYEKGVGFTRGCGSGLLSIMTILNYKYKITSITIKSGDCKSKIELLNNKLYLHSEVKYVYEGEILC